mgnify:CR=1 FL=1
MIRFGATGGDGRNIIGLGVTAENIERLRHDKPIFVAGETVGAPGHDIVIFYGESEYALTEKLAALIGPSTEIRQVRPEELPPDHPDWRPRRKRRSGFCSLSPW